jgi:Tfp pilus assembly protein FimT
MATIPISTICPLYGRQPKVGPQRARVRAEPEDRGSGFRAQDTGFRVQDSGFRILFRAGHFSAQCKTPRVSAQNSSLIPRPSRSGFTIIEVLLTLCLLVIISSMAWPQLEKTFSGQRLRKAADIVRTQWTKARVDAMRAGNIRVFRYEIGGNRYRVDMLSTDPVSMLTGTTLDPDANDSAQSLNNPTFTNPTASRPTGGSLDATSTVFKQVLPKDVIFVSSQTGQDPTTAAAGGATPGADPSSVDPTVANNVPAVGTGWSEPIFFYPDGTTSDTRLFLQNKQGRTVELMLRGVTGIVKIGDITAGGAQ